jgi:SAM-dependent methyltransferase
VRVEVSDHLDIMNDKDFLWLNLRELPYFRAMLRAVEAQFYQDFELPEPTLDLGCGDGHFATVTFDRQLDVGLDPWAGPIRQAAKAGGYRSLVQADGGKMPFPDGHFASALSNSVLEHIPHLEALLSETARVMRPGAPFVFCVPNQNFNPNLSVARAFDKMGLKRLGNGYRRFFDRIARHSHLDAPEVWINRLGQAGFEVDRWWNYFSPQALHVMEWGHYFGLPALLCHKLTGRWVLVGTPWNLALTRRIVQPIYDEPLELEEGVCTFYVTRRAAPNSTRAYKSGYLI